MRRPTRTRRLSIAAIASLLAFVILAALGIRSLRISDAWGSNTWIIVLQNGSLRFLKETGYYASGPTNKLSHVSGDARTKGPFVNLKFMISNRDIIPGRPGALKIHELYIPLWFPLLLLLIVPFRWLIARPANAMAFPINIDAKPS